MFGRVGVPLLLRSVHQCARGIGSAPCVSNSRLLKASSLSTSSVLPCHHRLDSTLRNGLHVRMMSTSSADTRPSLSAVLRQFYKLVHPDRFSEHPKEKEVNEHSMKEFLTYIQEYKKRPFGSAVGNPKRIPLTFFVRSSQQQQQQASQDQPTPPPLPLRKVEVELLMNASNPQSAKKRLAGLFNACGLASDFSLDSLLDNVVKSEGVTLQSFLAQGIPAARETIRQMAIDTVEINQIIKEIERTTPFKIFITTGQDSSYSSPDNKRTLIQFKLLVDIMIQTGMSERIGPIEVNFDAEVEWSQMSSDGQAMLSRNETIEQWSLFFQNQDWAEIRAQRETARKVMIEEERRSNSIDSTRKAKEAQVAALMGIRAFELKPFNKFESQISADGTISTPVTREEDEGDSKGVEYDQVVDKFLDSLISQKSLVNSHKNQFGRKLRNLEICYCPNMPQDISHHLAPTGAMQLSTSLPPKKLLEILQQHGKRAMDLTREEDIWETTRDFVEVRLGLKMLTVDYTFYYMAHDSVHKTRMAYKKLQQCADSLRAGAMSGLVVAISDHYGVSFDGTIYVKWDFEAEELILLLQGAQQQSLQ